MGENIKRENILIRMFKKVKETTKAVWDRLGQEDITDDIELTGELSKVPEAESMLLDNQSKKKGKSWDINPEKTETIEMKSKVNRSISNKTKQKSDDYVIE